MECRLSEFQVSQWRTKRLLYTLALDRGFLSASGFTSLPSGLTRPEQARAKVSLCSLFTLRSDSGALTLPASYVLFPVNTNYLGRIMKDVTNSDSPGPTVFTTKVVLPSLSVLRYKTVLSPTQTGEPAPEFSTRSSELPVLMSRTRI
jgi:hypothetical protein